MASVSDVLPVPLLDEPPELLEPPEPEDPPEPNDPKGLFPEEPPDPNDPKGLSPEEPPDPNDPKGESLDDPPEPEEPDGNWPVDPLALDEPEPELTGAELAAALVPEVDPGHSSWPTPTPARAARPSTAALAATRARRGFRRGGVGSLLDPGVRLHQSGGGGGGAPLSPQPPATEPGAAAAFGSPQPPATEPGAAAAFGSAHPPATEPGARRIRTPSRSRRTYAGAVASLGPCGPSPGAPGDPCDRSQPAWVWAMPAHCRPSRPDRPAATHPRQRAAPIPAAARLIPSFSLPR